MYNISDHDIDRIKGNAIRFVKRHGTPPTLTEDIIQEAHLALCQAAQDYDISRGISFESYSSLSAWNAMRNFLQKEANYDKFKKRLKDSGKDKAIKY